MIHELATTALADLSNMGLHFLHPFTDHRHPCSCLICASRENPNDHRLASLPKPATIPSLVPLATPSDLDLITTGSNAIRQLVLLSKEPISKLCNTFLSELKTHLGYQIQFQISYLQTLFHILTVVIWNDVFDKTQKQWFQKMFQENTKRAVVICAQSAYDDFTFLQQENSKLTVLVGDVTHIIKILIHGLMITKHRIMPKDILRFNSNAPITIYAPQVGMCLFL